MYYCCILFFSFCIGLVVPLSVVVPRATAASCRSDELETLSLQLAKKTLGSSRYLRLWRRWSDLGMDHIRDDLTNNLPHPIDPVAKSELDFNLGHGADLGIMPSFEDPGARSGYSVNLFCRVSLLADLLVDTGGTLPPFFAKGVGDLLYNHNNDTNDKNDDTKMSTTCRLVSIGGACGYDFVSAALVASFHSSMNNSDTSSRSSPVIVQATVFDYEEGWEDLVNTMSVSTATALTYYDHNHSCIFGGKCDITKPLSDPVNARTREVLDSTDLWTCQYCIAENAVQLRESNFSFFVGLFSAAREGAMFVFTETTHRLWPELMDVALATIHTEQGKGMSFEVGFPAIGGRNKTGRQMVLRKREGAVISNEKLTLCEEFRRDSQMHEQRLKNGIVRQKKRVPPVGNKFRNG